MLKLVVKNIINLVKTLSTSTILGHAKNPVGVPAKITPNVKQG